MTNKFQNPKKKKYSPASNFFALLFAAFLFAVFFGAFASASCSPSDKYCVSAPQVAAVSESPGLDFLGLKSIGDPGEVLSAVYRFALGFIGISALVMFVLGAAMYMSAADSQDRMNLGRGYMKNAVGGLALALLSYLILATINPDLVKGLNLKLIDIKPAQPTYLGILSEDDLRNAPKPASFNGTDEQWKKIQEGVIIPSSNKDTNCQAAGSSVGAMSRTCSALQEKIKNEPGSVNSISGYDTIKQRCAEICIPLL